jgi:hypothetical protein
MGRGYKTLSEARDEVTKIYKNGVETSSRPNRKQARGHPRPGRKSGTDF